MHPPTRVYTSAAPSIRFAALLGLLLAAGCDQLSTSSTPDYSTTARGNYERAVAEMKKQNYADSIKLFEYVRKKFSFSKYATLAELGIADANFGREKYLDAVDGYRLFIKDHPQHEKVIDGYADFRIGEAYYKEIPGEWFLVPPAYEKDMGPVRDALRELAGFVVQFPQSPYLEKAQAMEEDCIRRLAAHEIYVANFYMRRDHPMAAVGRLEALVRGDFLPKLASETGIASDRLTLMARNFMHKSMEPEVLLLLGRTYMKMDKNAEARSAFERLIEQHPGDYHAKKAQLFLARLGPMRAAAQPSRGPAPVSRPRVPMAPGSSEAPPRGEAEPAP